MQLYKNIHKRTPVKHQ